MVILFQDDFRTQNFVSWTGTSGNPSVVTNPILPNSYAAKSVVMGDKYYKDLNVSDLFVRFYVNFSRVFSGYTEICGIWSVDWANYISITYDGTYWNFGPNIAYAQRINANQRYCIEIERKVGVGNGVLNLWIDGVNVGTIDTLTINANAGQLQLGEPYSASSVTLYIDNVVVADAYIGPEEVIPANFILSYQSNPIAVPCTVNGQTLNSGNSIQVPSGTQVTISVPSEVNV